MQIFFERQIRKNVEAFFENKERTSCQSDVLEFSKVSQRVRVFFWNGGLLEHSKSCSASQPCSANDLLFESTAPLWWNLVHLFRDVGARASRTQCDR
jgi:hypothetical protein